MQRISTLRHCQGGRPWQYSIFSRHCEGGSPKQSRGKRNDVASNSGLLPASFLAVRNDVYDEKSIECLNFDFSMIYLIFMIFWHTDDTDLSRFSQIFFGNYILTICVNPDKSVSSVCLKIILKSKFRQQK